LYNAHVGDTAHEQGQQTHRNGAEYLFPIFHGRKVPKSIFRSQGFRGTNLSKSSSLQIRFVLWL
jgi:hypothetical protein